MKRNVQIDYLKCFAAISVIALHTMGNETRDLIGGPFYLLQAVPIFMILSGYNFTKAYRRRDIFNLRDCYNEKYLFSKAQRLVLPFLLVWLIALIYAIFVFDKDGLFGFLKDSVRFYIGPGNYYIPVIIGLVLIFPLMYKLALKSKKMCLIVSFTTGALFEIGSICFDLSVDIYRVVILRYVFAVSLGIIMALDSEVFKRKGLIAFGASFSIVYMIGVYYFNLTFSSYSGWWGQNTLSFMYPFLLVILAIEYLPEFKGIAGMIMAEIGKASYHIFLVQMIYYWINIPGLIFPEGRLYLVMPFNIVICTIIGITFFELDKRVFNN